MSMQTSTPSSITFSVRLATPKEVWEAIDAKAKEYGFICRSVRKHDYDQVWENIYGEEVFERHYEKWVNDGYQYFHVFAKNDWKKYRRRREETIKFFHLD